MGALNCALPNSHTGEKKHDLDVPKPQKAITRPELWDHVKLTGIQRNTEVSLKCAKYINMILR